MRLSVFCYLMPHFISTSHRKYCLLWRKNVIKIIEIFDTKNAAFSLRARLLIKEETNISLISIKFTVFKLPSSDEPA